MIHQDLNPEPYVFKGHPSALGQSPGPAQCASTPSPLRWEALGAMGQMGYVVGNSGRPFAHSPVSAMHGLQP